MAERRMWLGTYDALAVLQALDARDEGERLFFANGLQNLVHLGFSDTLAESKRHANGESAAAPNSKALSCQGSSGHVECAALKWQSLKCQSEARRTLIVLRFFLTVMATLSIVQKPASCQGSGQTVQAESKLQA
jgi:hypothetical protein